MPVTGRRQFGAIRRLPSGRWQARHRLASGQMVTAPTTFRTKADAARWLAALEVDQARGQWIDARVGHITLSEYALAWLAGRVKLAPRTGEIYAAQLRLYILPPISDAVPALGPIHLSDLNPELIRSWYGALAAHRSESAAAKAYVRLRQILTAAVNDDRIARSPCRIEGGGVERHAEQRFASLAELYALAAAVPARHRAMILLAGLAGLRQGELFALRRQDIDLCEGVVHVRRQRVRLEAGSSIEDAPKSAAGLRSVSLPRPLVEELRAHLAHWVGPAEDDYAFCSPDGGPVERSNFRDRIWLPATRTAGLEGLRFHDLRHTAGTLAARTGATTKELMARLGHASPRAAMIYQHASSDRDRLIADRLAAMTVEAGLASPYDQPTE